MQAMSDTTVRRLQSLGAIAFLAVLAVVTLLAWRSFDRAERPAPCSSAAGDAASHVLDDLRAVGNLDAGGVAAPAACGDSEGAVREGTWTLPTDNARRTLQLLQHDLAHDGWRPVARRSYQREVDRVRLITVLTLRSHVLPDEMDLRIAVGAL